MVGIGKVGIVLLLLGLFFLLVACFGEKQVVMEEGFVPSTGNGNSELSSEEVLIERFGEELGSRMLEDGSSWLSLTEEAKLAFLEDIFFHPSMDQQLAFWGLENLYDDGDMAEAFFRFHIDEIDSFYQYFGPGQLFIDAFESVDRFDPEDFKR